MSLKSMANGLVLGSLCLAATGAAAPAEARERHRGHGGDTGGYSEGRDWQDRRDAGDVYINRWGDVRRGNGVERGNWAQGRHDFDGDRASHHRDHTARNVAIGAFAAVLGLALAAESQRVQEQYYDERD